MNRVVVLLLLGILLLTGCTIEIDFDNDGDVDFKSSTERLRGSGNTITKDFDVEDFTALNISHAFNVKVIQGDVYTVQIEADDNIMEHIQVEVDDETLIIDLDQIISFSNIHTEATITMPTLSAVNLSGASTINLEGDFPHVDAFSLVVSGASTLNGTLTSDTMDMLISGSSRINMSGSSKQLNLKVSGASSCDMKEFSVDDVELSVSGASDADLKCNTRITGSASGASHITYTGNASSNVNVSGASSIKKR